MSQKMYFKKNNFLRIVSSTFEINKSFNRIIGKKFITRNK